MNYRSNLEAPDLRPYFKHIHERVEENSQGHTVISDFADKDDDDPVFGQWKRCWFWTLDEAAILYNCARQLEGIWLDIGAHTGWTTSYLNAAGRSVIAIDPMFEVDEFEDRFSVNTAQIGIDCLICRYPDTSDRVFAIEAELPIFPSISGAIIDGNHSAPCPLRDAQNSAKHLKGRGIILLHDYRGEPIKEAYRWLLANGFQGKVYTTPNGVAVCWRGDFTPPEHVPDQKLEPCV